MDLNDKIRKECLRRNYSNNTIKIYIFCVNRFLKKVNKDPKRVTKKDVREYLDYLVSKGKSGNTINIYLNSLKFTFENLLGKRMKLNIKYSKKPVRLPVVLSKQEVSKLFSFIKNEKHKLMVKFLYSSGFRLSELINLKVKDLEIEKGFGYVRKGKGNKDRIFIIANNIKFDIIRHINKEKLSDEDFLFRSNRKREYHPRSIQNIIRKASKLAKLNKKITPHTLRHSFATHLIENGYSVLEVQSLLGHKSPETTFTYLHTISSNLISVESPLDSLEKV